MYLKRLEAQGFKSFAQKTSLDFERGISAVVGPNGSGKSNIADALRFVLGEQGMKNIRAKKSEDLIFSGSHSKAKMNIGQVDLFFDNSDKAFPVDFAEVSISRKIFRDGENQYFINNSQVRLKDLSEFIAKAKLGLKGYTIINQGMGDYVINASPKERKEIMDEALGLREFQIKRNEAISKLNQTKNNLEKTESLIRELTPHLKYLKKQAEKLEEKTHLESELKKLEIKYVSLRSSQIKHNLSELSAKKEKADAEIKKLNDQIKEITKNLDVEEKKVSGFFDEVEKLEKSLFAVESKKSELERELGKLEGAISFHAQAKKHEPDVIPVNVSYIKERLKSIKDALRSIISDTSFENVKAGLNNLSDLFENLSSDIERGHVTENKKEEDSQSNEFEKLTAEKEKIHGILKKTDEEFLDIKEKIKNLNLSHHKEKENIFELRTDKNQKEMQLQNLTSQSEELNIEIAKEKQEEYLLEKEKNALKDSGREAELVDVSESSHKDASLISHDIERAKIRLESVEMIDESVVKEFNETNERMEFLTKETGDLNGAMESLSEAIKKLDLNIEEKFKKSFSQINKNFNKYFSILFNGGSASLEIMKEEESEDEEENTKKDSVLGVDVKVSLPGKKISSLSVMSGGERTLSSLALLFALVSTSPPPFMVLDEIDAPLDEANSNRFLKILDELKDKTQFVTITHNRETMRKADILYGVTMQESGISKLLSIKFDQAEKLAE